MLWLSLHCEIDKRGRFFLRLTPVSNSSMIYASYFKTQVPTPTLQNHPRFSIISECNSVIVCLMSLSCLSVSSTFSFCLSFRSRSTATRRTSSSSPYRAWCDVTDFRIDQTYLIKHTFRSEVSHSVKRPRCAHKGSLLLLLLFRPRITW